MGPPRQGVLVAKATPGPLGSRPPCLPMTDIPGQGRGWRGTREDVLAAGSLQGAGEGSGRPTAPGPAPAAVLGDISEGDISEGDIREERLGSRGDSAGGPGLGLGWPGTGDGRAHGAARRGHRCPAPRPLPPPSRVCAGPPPSWLPLPLPLPGGWAGLQRGGCQAARRAEPPRRCRSRGTEAAPRRAGAAGSPGDSGPWHGVRDRYGCQQQLLLCVTRHGRGSGARTSQTLYRCGLSPRACPTEGCRAEGKKDRVQFH